MVRQGGRAPCLQGTGASPDWRRVIGESCLIPAHSRVFSARIVPFANRPRHESAALPLSNTRRHLPVRGDRPGRGGAPGRTRSHPRFHRMGKSGAGQIRGGPADRAWGQDFCTWHWRSFSIRDDRGPRRQGANLQGDGRGERSGRKRSGRGGIPRHRRWQTALEQRDDEKGRRRESCGNIPGRHPKTGAGG